MRTEMLLPVIWNEANLNEKYKLIAETHECSDVCGFENDPEFGVDVFFDIFGEQEKIAGRFPSCKLWFFRRPYGKGTIVDFDIDWDVGYYSEYEDEYNHEVNLTELGGDDFANKLGILETSLAKDLAKKLAKKLGTYFDYVIKENCLCI